MLVFLLLQKYLINERNNNKQILDNNKTIQFVTYT